MQAGGLETSSAVEKAVPAQTRRDDGPPPSYLLFVNVAKKMNVGMSMRSAVAFGVSELWVAGGNSTAFNTFGHQGTAAYIPLRMIERGFHESLQYCKSRGAHIVAIEITPDAVPIHSFQFKGPTAFVAGNEGEGLTESHKAALRAQGASFVYVPQYGQGTASLNVSVATSIVLHHFALWAGYKEQVRDGELDKFAVAAPPDQRSGPWAAIAEEKRSARAAKKAAQGEEIAGEGEEHAAESEEGGEQ